MPIVIFAVCYWRILMVVRHQNKVKATHTGRSTRVQVVACKVTASTNFVETTTANATGNTSSVQLGKR